MRVECSLFAALIHKKTNTTFLLQFKLYANCAQQLQASATLNNIILATKVHHFKYKQEQDNGLYADRLDHIKRQ